MQMGGTGVAITAARDAIWWMPAAKMKQELQLRQDDEFAHPVTLVPKL
jgi:hypothetical protein